MVMKRMVIAYVMMVLGLLPIGLALAFGPPSLWLMPLLLLTERGLYRKFCRTFRRRIKKKGHRRSPDGLSKREMFATPIVTHRERKVKVLYYE